MPGAWLPPPTLLPHELAFLCFVAAAHVCCECAIARCLRLSTGSMPYRTACAGTAGSVLRYERDESGGAEDWWLVKYDDSDE